MANIVNGRCHAKVAPEGPPLIQHGNIVFQAHDVGWIVTGTFTIISMITSFWLINKHLQWYTHKKEQRYIVRILFMVPIYSVVSFASYLFWNHSTPLLLLRDCYESTVLTSFFYLLLTYLSPDVEEQKAIFRKNGLSRENDREARRKGVKVQKWIFPLSFIKSKPADGLYFLQMMKWGVLQYCVVRPVTTLVAVILDYIGLYCEDSWSPGWGHVYITVLVSISVSVSMYCLLQMYLPVSIHLKKHKPILKLFAVKAVVFLTFWQASFLSLLATFGVVKDTQFMTADNINIGLGAILETFEMVLFAFLHIKAFTYRPYKNPPDRTARLRSLGHAMNFAETFRELRASILYMAHRYKGRETDMQARRDAALEGVFGQSRFDITQKQKTAVYEDKTQRSVAVGVDVDEVVHVGEERQWLGSGDDYAYGLRYQTRKEKSESLGMQIEKELTTRGYGRRERSRSGHTQYEPIGNLDLDPAPLQNQGHSRGQRSWWRGAFNFVSQSGNDPEQDHYEDALTVVPHRTSRRASWMRKTRQLSPTRKAVPPDFHDPPPPSVIRTYRGTRDRGVVLEDSFPLAPSQSAIPPIFLPQPLSESPTPSLSGSPPRQLKRKAPPQMHPFPVTSPNLLSPPTPGTDARSDRADSLLGRVFPISNASHSHEALSDRSGPTSSNSHRSGVRLGGKGVVNISGTIMAQAPVVVEGPPKVNSQERLVEMPLPVLTPSEPRTEPTPKRPSSHMRDSAHYQVPEPGPSQQREEVKSQSSQGIYSDRRRHLTGTLYPLSTHAMRREQVVLPSPLAPAATSSTGNRQHQFNQVQVPESQSPTAMSPSRDSPRSSSVQFAHRKAGQRSLPSPTAQAGYPPPSVSPVFASPPGLRHSTLSSPPRSPRTRESDRMPPQVPAPQLRRSTHNNVKRHSYGYVPPGQAPRSSRDRPSRRSSAPPDASQMPSLQREVPGFLQSVPEGSFDRL